MRGDFPRLRPRLRRHAVAVDVAAKPRPQVPGVEAVLRRRVAVASARRLARALGEERLHPLADRIGEGQVEAAVDPEAGGQREAGLDDATGDRRVHLPQTGFRIEDDDAHVGALDRPARALSLEWALHRAETLAPTEVERAARLAALEAAMLLYAAPADWRALMLRGMREDFSWQAQGRLYEDFYRRMLAPQ